MKRQQKLPELLAPAGDFDALVAAVAAGADAVYIGGARFGARAYAKNFSHEEMAAAVRYAHMFGVRVYVTLNTLIYDKETEEALAYAKSLYEMGVDALIIADLGMAALIGEKIPELELHASTQMGVHNTAGADFAARLGCRRVVLARECSEDDIKKIVDSASAECEVFVHGALCVCHSGQCLFSSLVGGRSGNRGECAQPCRLPYNNGTGYPLSLKDLSLADYVTSLISSGVSSLKIEGRMKSADYVYSVVSVYRSLLDAARNADGKDRKRLDEIFSRGGFTDGYFKGSVMGKMTGVRTEEQKQRTREISGAEFKKEKLPIYARATFRRGECARLELSALPRSRWDGTGVSYEPLTVECMGDAPEEALSAPMIKESLAARLAKMGNTPFCLDEENIEILLDDGLNMAPSLINALRRCAAEKLEALYSAPIEKICKISSDSAPRAEFDLTKRLNKAQFSSALFFRVDTFTALCREKSDLIKDIDVSFVPLAEYEALDEDIRRLARGVYIPPVIMEREWNEATDMLARARTLGAEYALVGNISHVKLVNEYGFAPIADFRMNISNKYTAALLADMGIANAVLSAELTLPMARDIGGALITLGRVPLMLTERCFMKENFGCERCSRVSLCDRKGAKFPMMREWKHRNIIFNSLHTYMGDKRDELSSFGIKRAHFIFSSENAKEAAELLRTYKSGQTLPYAHRRIGKR